MANTWFVGADVAPQALTGWAATVFKDFKSKRPKSTTTLVINCHGFTYKDSGGYGLDIGTGIRLSDAVQFEKLSGYCDQIFIVACQAARISRPGAASGDGNLLLSAIAKSAKANVTASTANQTVWTPWLPIGYIDDFEGTVLTYGPDGDVIAVEHH